MADIKVRIEVNPNQETEFLGSIQNQVGTSGSTNNLSNVSVKTDSLAVFQNIPNRQNAISGINGLSLGQDLVFDENGYLDNQDLQGAVIEDEQNPDEFVWGVVPESGEYHVKLTFTNAQNLKDIIVRGDNVVGQFPTQAIIDGSTTIYSDDNYWAINLQTESNTHTLEFTHWNRTNYNACLTLIAVMLRYYEIDKYNGLKSIESLSQSTGQPKEIFYGVIPSSGSLEIIDMNGEIKEMLDNGIIPNSNVNIEVIANGKQVQGHISSNSEYKEVIGNKSLNLELNDDLLLWENINFKGYQLNTEKSLYNVLSEILISFYTQNEIDEMLDSTMYNEQNIQTRVIDYLRSIMVEYPYLPKSTLKEAIDKICAVAQLNVYKDQNNKLKFVSSRPLKIENKAIISIPKNRQSSILNRDIIVNNKYSSVNVSYMQSNIVDMSLSDVTYKYYDYDVITKYPQFYTKVIDDTSVNPNLVVLYDELPSYANVTTPPSDDYESYSNWYYYIGKFNINYDISDLSIMRDFNVTVGYKIQYFFPGETPVNAEGAYTKESVIDYEVITPLASSYTDEEIISEWIAYNNDKQTYEVKSGVPNWEFKVRKDQDGSLSIIYISLFKTTYWEMYPINSTLVEYVASIYNTLSIYVSVPALSQTSITQQENADISISDVELLQNNTIIGETPIYNIIQSNILSDYANGIITGKISVICQDYYDINGNLVRSWSNGDIINVGDIVRLDDENGNSLYKYDKSKDIYFKVTGRNFRKNGIPLLDLELQEAKRLFNSKSFAEDSWDTISKISQSGTASYYYKIGDEKVVTLTTGQQITLQILGFNHDVTVNDALAGITMGIKDLWFTRSPMNNTDTNNGGWEASLMRNSTISTILNTLPEDLRDVIQTVRKPTSDGTSNIVNSNDKLWLFSFVEITGKTTLTYPGEGIQYEYWKQHNRDLDRIKRISGEHYSGNSGMGWWLRSPYIDRDSLGYQFRIITGGGQVDDYSAAEATWQGGICFGLCV